MTTKTTEGRADSLIGRQIHLWPTHWAGGSSSYQFKGENVPWLELNNGPAFAVLTDSSPWHYTIMERMVASWNSCSSLKSPVEDLQRVKHLLRYMVHNGPVEQAGSASEALAILEGGKS